MINFAQGQFSRDMNLETFSIARVNKWQKITWPWGPVKIYDRRGEDTGRTGEGGQSSLTEFKGGNYRKLTANEEVLYKYYRAVPW